jgi:hypothetical protein
LSVAKVLEVQVVSGSEHVTYWFEDGDFAFTPVMVWLNVFFLVVEVEVQLGQVRGSVIVDPDVVVLGSGWSQCVCGFGVLGQV